MTCSLPLLMAAALAAPADPPKGRFEYDPADEAVQATMIGGEGCYDPHVVVRRTGATGGSSASVEEVWLTWLEFEPGKGDRIWVGTRAAASSRSPEGKDQKEGGRDAARLSSPKSRPPKEDGWTARKCLTPEPGIYKNPTLTIDNSGGFWLTYEQQQGEKWSVAARRLDGSFGGRDFGELSRAASRPPASGNVEATEIAIGPGINHRIAAAPDGGAWIVWQAPKDGQFDVRAARLTEKGIAENSVLGTRTSKNDLNEWQPDLLVLPDGDVHVVWDACESADYSFDIYHAARTKGKWRAGKPVMGKRNFEARARLASDPSGRILAVWEEGNANWGGRYISRMRKLNQEHLEITDKNGPLHAFRQLRFGLVEESGRPLEPRMPMPAMEKLAKRPNAPKGVEHLGGYYERAEPCVDGIGRLWVAYRHYYLPWVGVEKTTHKQEDWGIYARCFDGKEWSKLFRCDIGQGDGMQRLSIAPFKDGIVLAYTTGRTDRRPGTSQPGVALASISLSGSAYQQRSGYDISTTMRDIDWTRPPAASQSDYQVFFGDLHRHTDLSLCYVPTDGTMDDAYRFAIDVAGLDFMGITDHSRDIAEGNAKSLLWWRCRKEVSRHDLSPNFIPMYAYEHSRGGEDHNVISLKPNLWPDTMPFPELWKRMDNDSFSIPHQTLCKDIPSSGEMPLGLAEKTWEYRDDARRPLMEIYQGCRDRAIERDAHVALGKGHIMGFIASSDHLSTNASFAGVWAKEKTREAIFRAMQARRTFGATDRMRLKVTMGEHWMGEKVAASEVKPIHVEVQGTGSLEKLELIVDGQVKQTLPQESERVATEITLPALTGSGIHYFYIRVRQSDGNQAWSSPIWIEG